MSQTTLQYERIKAFVLSGIEDSTWAPGARLPSENQLASQFSSSRMTANRAIKELEAEGVVERIQGKGTFVAPPRPLQSVLQIQGIDEEVRARGSEYSCRVIHLKATTATVGLGQKFQMSVGSKLFASSILHLENGAPVQLERRWVRPSIWHDFLEQDFSERTPHEYLMGRNPFTRGEHTIEARLPNSRDRRMLEMGPSDACLLIYRRTWVRRTVASYVQLLHPGNRFQLTTSMTR
jgi:GntR family histidine utilization transcriptional repressor